MANSFGSLFVGSSGLRGAQNALNVVANNLSNIDTKGYVRQRVAFEDEPYNQFAMASVSYQKSGLGVQIGDVLHTRDQFLDRAYRTENGRQSFYQVNYDAASEIEVQLQEMTGQQFSEAITDLYEAFAEYAKDPSSDVIQNLVVQKGQLFISRAKGVYDGLISYQENMNTKLRDDVNRINEIGKTIVDLNRDIQRIEAGGVETAMQLRDERDKLIDELSSLAKIEYNETWDGIVKIKLEGVDFVTDSTYFKIALQEDKSTGYLNPYWQKLSDPLKNDYAYVFDTSACDPKTNTDIGEVKGILLARGHEVANYLDLETTQYVYENGAREGTVKRPGLADSVVMNSQAELDKLVHTLVTKINEFLSPTTTLSEYKPGGNEDMTLKTSDITVGGNTITVPDGFSEVPVYDRFGTDTTKTTVGMVGRDINGRLVTITSETRFFDDADPALGSDYDIPSRELFSRDGVDRYVWVDLVKQQPDGTYVSAPITYEYTDENGNPATKEITGFYMYQAEDEDFDPDSLYTLNKLEINQEVLEKPSLLPHTYDRPNGRMIAYDMAENIYNLWESVDYSINPSDETPCSIHNFYTKWVGELATTGSIYKTTAESLESTRDNVEASRQQVIGVGSDDELTEMIKYQNAYNASSRYINVVSQMIDYLLNSLVG